MTHRFLHHLAALALPVAFGLAPNGYRQEIPSDGTVILAESIEALVELEYQNLDGWVPTLDIYRNRSVNRPAPVVVNFHAEGKRKENESLSILPFLEMGMTVANVEYRPARQDVRGLPSADRRGSVEDAICALRWLGAHAKEYRLDLSRIVVTGRSSGGHKALMAALSGTYGVVAGCVGLDTPAVAAVVNWYGHTSEATSADTPELRYRLSVDEFVNQSAPPLLIVYGDASADDVRQARALVTLWGGFRQPVQTIVVRGGGRGNFGVPDSLRIWAGIRDFLHANGVLN